jgi:hypothetical protein
VRYGLAVNNTALLHASFVLIPLVVAGILALFIYRSKGPHPATYNIAETWTHDPILWAAEEPADHGHGGHGAHLTIGGGASGKW